jgi:hypothetical protein
MKTKRREGSITGCDDDRVGGAELATDRGDDAVDLSCEPVDDARLEPGDGRLADHARRLDVVDLDEPGRAGEQRVHRRLDPGRENTAHVLPVG